MGISYNQQLWYEMMDKWMYVDKYINKQTGYCKLPLKRA